MNDKYEGTVHQTQQTTQTHQKLKWPAFASWLTSVFVSFIPLYVHILNWLANNSNNKQSIWILLLDCIARQDVLWIVSTILLFAIVNCITNYLSGTRRKLKWHIAIFTLLGAVFFILLDVTWVLFKYSISLKDQHWPVSLGITLSILSLLIAAPLQINSHKSEEQK